MLIRFGIRTYTIRSWLPHEAGLPSDPSFVYHIVLLQHYFHILYIPFFGIKTSWAIRKADGKKYHVPAEWTGHLENLRKQYTTPWYYLLLPFIGPVAGVVIGILLIAGGAF